MKKLLIVLFLFTSIVVSGQHKAPTTLDIQQQIESIQLTLKKSSVANTNLVNKYIKTQNELKLQIDTLNQKLAALSHKVTISDAKVDSASITPQECIGCTIDHVECDLVLIGILITVFSAFIGIGGPLFFNSQMKDMIANQKESIADKIVSVEKFVEMRSTTSEKLVDGQIKNASTMTNKNIYDIQVQLDEVKLLRKEVETLNEKIKTSEITAKESSAAAEESAKQAEINKLFSEAYNEKDIQGQIDKYTQVIELDPTNVDAYYNRGVIYGENKDYDKAMADYNTAIELDPKYAPAYNNMAWLWAHLEEDRLDEALAYAKKAIDLDTTKLTFFDTIKVIYEKLAAREGDGTKKAEYIKFAKLNEERYYELKK